MQRKRSKYFVVAAIVAAFIAGFWLGAYLFEPVEENIPSEYFHQMTLLTWKGWSGDLCFLLLPMTQRGRATHDFWSKWHGQGGVSKLKEALVAVPADQYVYWNDWPNKFTYPEKAIVQDVIVFAKSKGVHLEESPAVQ